MKSTKAKKWHDVTEVKCIHCMGTGTIKRKSIKEDTILKIIDLRREGNSLRKIASIVGIGNPQTVSNIIRKILLEK